MADITLQTISVAGLVPSMGNAAASDKVVVDAGDRVFVTVTNGGGSSIDVTIPKVTAAVQVPGVGAVAVPDIEVAVAAGATRHIGPIPSAYVGTDGRASVNYSSTTSVTRTALRLPPPA